MSNVVAEFSSNEILCQYQIDQQVFKSLDEVVIFRWDAVGVHHMTFEDIVSFEDFW
jgi:hypothetical protein